MNMNIIEECASKYINKLGVIEILDLIKQDAEVVTVIENMDRRKALKYIDQIPNTIEFLHDHLTNDDIKKFIETFDYVNDQHNIIWFLDDNYIRNKNIFDKEYIDNFYKKYYKNISQFSVYDYFSEFALEDIDDNIMNIILSLNTWIDPKSNLMQYIHNKVREDVNVLKEIFHPQMHDTTLEYILKQDYLNDIPYEILEYYHDNSVHAKFMIMQLCLNLGYVQILEKSMYSIDYIYSTYYTKNPSNYNLEILGDVVDYDKFIQRHRDNLKYSDVKKYKISWLRYMKNKWTGNL